MRAGDILAALEGFPLTTPAAFTAGQPLVVISPHPDDESLGVGGLIAAATAARQDVRIVLITDGSGSHPRSATYPRDRLVALRKAEAAAAVDILGVAPDGVSHLDLPDTAAPLAGPAFEAAVAHIASVVRDAGASRLLCTWGHDPHCDHEAAAAMARAVKRRLPGLALWSYPIWGLHLLPPDAEVEAPLLSGVRIVIAPWLATKRAAIAAHASQITTLIDDDPTGFHFTPELLAPFLRSYETLIAED